jgi:hypothetical protein
MRYVYPLQEDTFTVSRDVSLVLDNVTIGMLAAIICPTTRARAEVFFRSLQADVTGPHANAQARYIKYAVDTTPAVEEKMHAFRFGIRSASGGE